MIEETIEVRIYSNDELVSTGYADPPYDPESALLAARTMWDEAFDGIMGQRRRAEFWVDDKLVRSLTKRP